MPPLIAAARALVGSARRRMKGLRKRQRPYRPDLTDSTFLANLELPGEGSAAAAHARPEERHRIRARVVAHFVERTAPRFFVDIGSVPGIAAALRRDRPDWVRALRERVEADLHEGLRVVNVRGQPLSRGFDWRNVPSGPGDLLFSVQPHRFGFLPRLALAVHHGMPCLQTMHEVIEGWMGCAVEGHRMAYVTPLVVQYRVLAATWTFALVAALPADAWRERVLFALLKIVSADMRYLRTTIGHSYPNNHLLADGFAGWYCGTLYPEFQGAEACRSAGEAIFLRELQRQFYADGTSFEHSTHYHELGCEMAVAYVLLCRRNGIEPPVDALASLQRMLAFQTALGGPQCQPLAIGDTLEDPLFPLDARHGWAAGAMRVLYRTLFDGAAASPPLADCSAERAWWLLGRAHPEPAIEGEGRLPASFPQGGFYLLDDARLDGRLVFRSGPAPELQISAGHAHADVLSVYLSLCGRAAIVNSGTYTYRRVAASADRHAAQWRAYFSGPASHNAVVSVEDPYGRVQADFRPPDLHCRVVPRRDHWRPGITWLESEVTGPGSLRGHRRGVVHLHGEYWVVYDLFANAVRDEDASVGLQFAPDVHLQPDDGAFALGIGSAHCTLALGPTLRDPRIVRGSLTPLGGWVSPRYGELEAAPQLLAQLVHGERASAFVLQPGSGTAQSTRVTALACSATRFELRIECAAWTDTLVFGTAFDDGRVEASGITRDADLVWARTVGGRTIDLRQVDPGASGSSHLSGV